MSTTTRQPVRPTTPADLWRLADQAEQRGIKILLTEDGSHFATSNTNATLLHRVSERGCDCRGFSYWQRCTHHSLLLSELGRLSDLESVVTDVVILDEQPAPCRSCRGSGFLRMTTEPALSDWVMAPCTSCAGHQAAPTTGSNHAAALAA